MSRVHISLLVSDLEESVGFYEKTFGQPASKRRPGYANFRLDDPGLMLALVESQQAATPAGSSASHYGVEVGSRDELESWRQRVQSASLANREEINVTCCYAQADKVWLQDPDGNKWELWVRTGDAETMREPVGHATTPAEKPAEPSARSCC